MFSSWSGKRQGYLLLSSLFNIVLKVLTGAIRQDKGIKGTQSRKEKATVFMHRGYDYYVEKPKEPTKMFLELIHEFCHVARYRINI